MVERFKPKKKVERFRFEKKNNGWGGARPGAGGAYRKDGSLIQHDTYRPEYAEIAKALCSHGATDPELADYLGISPRTLYSWRAAHKEFLEACKIGKNTGDDRVVRSFYQRCTGYEVDELKVWATYDQKLGEWTTCKEVVRKHIPPDTDAGFKWLRCRKPEEWRESNNLINVNLNGEAINALEELASRYNRLTTIEGTATLIREPDRGSED